MNIQEGDQLFLPLAPLSFHSAVHPACPSFNPHTCARPNRTEPRPNRTPSGMSMHGGVRRRPRRLASTKTRGQAQGATTREAGAPGWGGGGRDECTCPQGPEVNTFRKGGNGLRPKCNGPLEKDTK